MRQEEALASVNHSVAEVDTLEKAVAKEESITPADRDTGRSQNRGLAVFRCRVAFVAPIVLVMSDEFERITDQFRQLGNLAVE